MTQMTKEQYSKKLNALIERSDLTKAQEKLVRKRAARYQKLGLDWVTILKLITELIAMIRSLFD